MDFLKKGIWKVAFSAPKADWGRTFSWKGRALRGGHEGRGHVLCTRNATFSGPPRAAMEPTLLSPPATSKLKNLKNLCSPQRFPTSLPWSDGYRGQHTASTQMAAAIVHFITATVPPPECSEHSLTGAHYYHSCPSRMAFTLRPGEGKADGEPAQGI